MTKERRRELTKTTEFCKFAMTYGAKIYRVPGKFNRYIVSLPPSSGVTKEEFLEMAKERLAQKPSTVDLAETH